MFNESIVSNSSREQKDIFNQSATLHYEYAVHWAAFRSGFDYGCFIVFNISLFFSQLILRIIRLLMGKATSKQWSELCPKSNQVTSCRFAPEVIWNALCRVSQEKTVEDIRCFGHSGWNLSKLDPLVSNLDCNSGKCQSDLRHHPRVCCRWLLMLNWPSVVPVNIYWLLIRNHRNDSVWTLLMNTIFGLVSEWTIATFTHYGKIIRLNFLVNLVHTSNVNGCKWNKKCSDRALTPGI